MPKHEDRPNCMRCKDTVCLDLFYESKQSKDAGNELYVYSLLGKKIAENMDLGAYVCANGTFLTASCLLADSIPTNKQSYMSDILSQVARDFKASIFLAFSGHYRQAMQVLRCGFENIISGVYYYSDLINLRKNNAKDDDIAKLNQRFEDWKRGSTQTNINNSIEVLRRIGFLSFEEKNNWQNFCGLLSKFIHTPEEFVTRIEHGGKIKLKGEITCLAATYYNEKQLIEWSNCYQRVFTILLKTIAEFHPEAFNTESGRIAVRNIKSELEGKEKQIASSVQVMQILSKFSDP